MKLFLWQHWRFLLLYATLYAGFGVFSPYFPALLGSRGLSPERIGVVLAAGTVVRLIAGPVAGQVADRYDARGAVLALCALTAAGLGTGFSATSSFEWILVVALFQAASLAPLAPLSDTLVLGAAAPRRDGIGFSYGTVRGAGSAAFVLGTLVSARTIGGFGITAIVWSSALLLAGAALAAAKAPSLPVTPGAPQVQATHGFGALLRLASFRRLIVVAALILGSHAMHDTFAVIRWRAAGIGVDLTGLLWSEQVVGEVLVFTVLGSWLLSRLGVRLAAALAASAAVLRWGAMGSTASVSVMMLIEPLHGITFALLHLAAMRLMAEIVPSPLAASALTIYGTLGIGAATAIVTLASGPLYAHLGARAFWVMALICLAALPFALSLREPRLQSHA